MQVVDKITVGLHLAVSVNMGTACGPDEESIGVIELKLPLGTPEAWAQKVATLLRSMTWFPEGAPVLTPITIDVPASAAEAHAEAIAAEIPAALRHRIPSPD